MKSHGLFQGKKLITLLIMVSMWITANFNYGMISIFCKHLPGSVFLNYSISGLSEIAAHVIVGAFFQKLTPRWTFFIGYACSLVGSISLIFQNSFEDNTPLIAFFVLFCKFGISMSMCACYVSTPYVFPVMQAGLAFGICNIGGRLFSIASPYVAEIKIPTPMICFSIMSIIGLILCLFVSTSED